MSETTNGEDNQKSITSKEKIFKSIEDAQIDNIQFVKIRNVEQLLNILQQSNKRIADKLKSLVGTAEFEIVLFNLIVDDRGNRAGFDPEILSILIQLSQRHNDEYGHFEKADKVWESIKDVKVNIKKKE